jgi:hypothetical protein
MCVSPASAPDLFFVVPFVPPEIDPGEQHIDPGNSLKQPQPGMCELKTRQFRGEGIATRAVHGGATQQSEGQCAPQDRRGREVDIVFGRRPV